LTTYSYRGDKKPIRNALSRRAFLAQAAAGLASTSKRLIIDTHLEEY
jgi:hypothetical protein